ncbi:ATP-binding cassette domain-containing protein [Flavobacterium aquicola]|uniref:ABC-type lipopolysaccharide export system ATPase subunit n=1 Tax=Flavobacterium aquicola TaxID=1682742 RepID=A0A3E0ELU3_9FLAO|nr:ATP-binding cassette domain-containing protein [Flavobacterium aquicola]REG99158.1 ABC-type lipopolysaccharide export system ATPase subunit [Flavobacterium aquicola]
MKKHLLEIDSVQKTFDNKNILSDVYLKCETNDIIGLLGRNGSGKSTLLKIIFGIESADFKFVRIDSVVKSKTKDLFAEISYLPQDNCIPKVLSIKKAIQLSVSKEKIQEFCSDEIIVAMLDKKISHLSGGELRYLEIKIILYNSSKFALLDEPYNGLSPLLVEKVNELIAENSKTKGIIISDHNYENVIKVSNKLILLKEGKAHHLLCKEELIEKGYLKEGML